MESYRPSVGGTTSEESQKTGNSNKLMMISPSGPTANDLKLSKSLEDTLEDCDMFESVEGIEARCNVLKKLDSIVKDWIRSVSMKKNIPEAQLARVTGKLYTFGSFALGVNVKDADIDMLCVAPRHVDRAEFFSSFCDRLRMESGVKDIRAVEEAYVPVIKMTLDGIEIDILFARLALSEITDDLDLCDENLLKNLDIRCIRSLNGVRVTRTILQLVPNKDTYRMTLRAVKLWAKRKGFYSNAFGFLGGVSWALLVAHVCRLYPNAAPSTLVNKFFLVFSNWKWPTPVMLKPMPDDNALGFPVWDPRQNVLDQFHLMPVITPVYPQQNSTYNVTVSSRTLMVEEFYNALQVTCRILHGDDVWTDLFRPSDFFLKYKHYLTVTAGATCYEHYVEWTGLVESKIRILVGNLEKNHLIRLVHVNPQSFPLSPSSFTCKWFIGLTFIKQHGLEVNLTYDIQSFSELVHRQADSSGVLKSGMTVNVQYIRRKQLSDFLPDAVINASSKSRKEVNRAKGHDETGQNVHKTPQISLAVAELSVGQKDSASQDECRTPPAADKSLASTIAPQNLFRLVSDGDSNEHATFSQNGYSLPMNNAGDNVQSGSKRETTSLTQTFISKRFKSTGEQNHVN